MFLLQNRRVARARLYRLLLIPDLTALNGYVVDKVEGLAIFPDGTAWISTDNDGVDDSSGETYFWSPGQF